MPGSLLTYVLVTPARNERDLIEGAIRSVIAQTHLPSKWVIVSDGSTDGTDEIVARFAKEHTWIELLRMPEHRDRSFAAKAVCFNAGYDHLKSTNFDLIGNLDADITFGQDYYEFLVGNLQRCPDSVLRARLSSRMQTNHRTTPTRTSLPIFSTSPAPARCSGADVSKKSVVTPRSKAGGLIGLPSPPLG